MLRNARAVCVAGVERALADVRAGKDEVIDELLGTASADPDIHARFIASKAPDAPSRADEVAAIGAEAV